MPGGPGWLGPCTRADAAGETAQWTESGAQMRRAGRGGAAAGGPASAEGGAPPAAPGPAPASALGHSPRPGRQPRQAGPGQGGGFTRKGRRAGGGPGAHGTFPPLRRRTAGSQPARPSGTHSAGQRVQGARSPTSVAPARFPKRAAETVLWARRKGGAAQKDCAPPPQAGPRPPPGSTPGPAISSLSPGGLFAGPGPARISSPPPVPEF